MLNQYSIQPNKDCTAGVELVYGNVRIAKYPKVNVLRRIFGPRERKCSPHHHCIIGVDEFLKCGRITTLRSNNQLGAARIPLMEPEVETLETGSFCHFLRCKNLDGSLFVPNYRQADVVRQRVPVREILHSSKQCHKRVPRSQLLHLLQGRQQPY